MQKRFTSTGVYIVFFLSDYQQKSTKRLEKELFIFLYIRMQKNDCSLILYFIDIVVKQRIFIKYF